jgi:hypothetical protein
MDATWGSQRNSRRVRSWKPGIPPPAAGLEAMPRRLPGLTEPRRGDAPGLIKLVGRGQRCNGGPIRPSLSWRDCNSPHQNWEGCRTKADAGFLSPEHHDGVKRESQANVEARCAGHPSENSWMSPIFGIGWCRLTAWKETWVDNRPSDQRAREGHPHAYAWLCHSGVNCCRDHTHWTGLFRQWFCSWSWHLGIWCWSYRGKCNCATDRVRSASTTCLLRATASPCLCSAPCARLCWAGVLWTAVSVLQTSPLSTGYPRPRGAG